jgi:hypothetical protein
MRVDKDKLVETLRGRLHEAFMARYHGAAYARIARAVGFADGYMQAMIDSGLVTDKEMIQVVVAERQRALRTDEPLESAPGERSPLRAVETNAA